MSRENIEKKKFGTKPIMFKKERKFQIKITKRKSVTIAYFQG
jgi:hypothetical protein